jgi:hypothetical protein
MPAQIWCYSPRPASEEKESLKGSKLGRLIVWYAVVMVVHDEFFKMIFVKKQSFIYILSIEGYTAQKRLLAKKRRMIMEAQ